MLVVRERWSRAVECEAARVRGARLEEPRRGRAGHLRHVDAVDLRELPAHLHLATQRRQRGEVEVGWRLAEGDGVDVSTMTGGEATRLLEARAATARHLEFDRTLAPLPNYNHGA